MARTISNWLHRASTGWLTLAALLVFVVFTATVLPSQATQAEADSGGAPSPDMSLLYTPRELYAMAEAYGPEGRVAYVRARFTFDLVWPVVYLAFLATSISWLSRRAFAPDSAWQRLNLVPVFATLLDYLENIAAALVIGRYPARTLVVDTLAPVFTLTKWMLVGGSFVLLLGVLGVAIWRSLGHRD